MHRGTCKFSSLRITTVASTKSGCIITDKVIEYHVRKWRIVLHGFIFKIIKVVDFYKKYKTAFPKYR